MKEKKMKVLKRTVPLWALLLVVLMSASAVMAAVVISQQIDTQIQILAAYGMEVYDTDQSTLLTSVDFGSCYRGDRIITPTEPEYYWIKNTGEADVWVSFSVTDPISDVGITVHEVGNNIWDGGIADPDEISTSPIAPGAQIKFLFYVDVGSSAPFGTYTPTITFNAHDTTTG